MWLRDGSPGQGSPGSSGSRDLQSWLFCAGACAAGWGRSDACDCAQPSAAEQGRGGGQRDGAADIGAERGGPVETDGSPGRAAISSGVSGMTVSSLMGMLMPPSRPDSARSLPRMPAGREGRCAAGAQQGTGGRGPQAEGGAPDPQSRKRLQVVGKSLGSVSGGGGGARRGLRAACSVQGLRLASLTKDGLGLVVGHADNHAPASRTGRRSQGGRLRHWQAAAGGSVQRQQGGAAARGPVGRHCCFAEAAAGSGAAHRRGGAAARLTGRCR